MYNKTFGWLVSAAGKCKERRSYESITIHTETLREMQNRPPQGRHLRHLRES